MMSSMESKDWADIVSFLHSLSYGHYVERFKENGYDLWDIVCDLTINDLKAIKIKHGHAMRIHKQFALKKIANSAPPRDTPMPQCPAPSNNATPHDQIQMKVDPSKQPIVPTQSTGVRGNQIRKIQEHVDQNIAMAEGIKQRMLQTMTRVLNGVQKELIQNKETFDDDAIKDMNQRIANLQKLNTQSLKSLKDSNCASALFKPMLGNNDIKKFNDLMLERIKKYHRLTETESSKRITQLEKQINILKKKEQRVLKQQHNARFQDQHTVKKLSFPITGFTPSTNTGNTNGDNRTVTSSVSSTHSMSTDTTSVNCSVQNRQLPPNTAVLPKVPVPRLTPAGSTSFGSNNGLSQLDKFNFHESISLMGTETSPCIVPTSLEPRSPSAPPDAMENPFKFDLSEINGFQLTDAPQSTARSELGSNDFNLSILNGNQTRGGSISCGIDRAETIKKLPIKANGRTFNHPNSVQAMPAHTPTGQPVNSAGEQLTKKGHAGTGYNLQNIMNLQDRLQHTFGYNQSSYEGGQNGYPLGVLRMSTVPQNVLTHISSTNAEKLAVKQEAETLVARSLPNVNIGNGVNGLNQLENFNFQESYNVVGTDTSPFIVPSFIPQNSPTRTPATMPNAFTFNLSNLDHIQLPAVLIGNSVPHLIVQNGSSQIGDRSVVNGVAGTENIKKQPTSNVWTPQTNSCNTILTTYQNFEATESEVIRKLIIENPEADTKSLFARFRQRFPNWKDDTESYTEFYRMKWMIEKKNERKQTTALQLPAAKRRKMEPTLTTLLNAFCSKLGS